MRRSAASVAEAIAIAEEGKLSGEWDLFRGQTNANWLVTSSAERLWDTGREQALERFKRFIGWAETVDAMKGYFANPDSLWAIAQHYSLQTNFIDFSTDPRVAAFFACDTKAEPNHDQRAAIICLNSDDFLKFWKQIGPAMLKGVPETSYPHLIRIHVDNLLRLQRQKGCFLWNPVHGIERFYDFDRITFPYLKNDPAIPKREEIYPVHQSELEKLLTQFFMNEQMLEGDEIIATMKIPVFKIEVPVDHYDVKSWWPAGISTTSDWVEANSWGTRQIVHSDNALPGTRIELDSSQSFEQCSEALVLILSPTFIDANRTLTLDIRAKTAGDFPPDCEKLFVCVRRLWNGMRTLPYSAYEIETALKKTLELFSVARRGTNSRDVFGGDGLYVEMGSNADGRGAYSRGTVTKKALIDAHNPAFVHAARADLEASNPGFRNMTDITLAPAFLQRLGRPWERFTFSGLKKLMAEELIPTQIAWRVETDEANLRTVIYFSPTEFKVFGLA